MYNVLIDQILIIIQNNIEGVMAEHAEGSSLEYLSERPQKPLPSDCCDTGCNPCVMDLYHEELAAWERLRAMSVQEREQWIEQRRSHDSLVSPVLSPGAGYRQFELINIKQVTSDSFLYSFRLPKNQVLGVRVGQHAILRFNWHADTTVNEFLYNFRMKNASGHYVTRQFTPVSHPNQKGSFDVLIKVLIMIHVNSHNRSMVHVVHKGFLASQAPLA